MKKKKKTILHQIDFKILLQYCGIDFKMLLIRKIKFLKRKNVGHTAFIFVNANFDNWKGKWEWGIIGIHVIRHKGNACITVFTSNIINQENHMSLKPLLKLCVMLPFTFYYTSLNLSKHQFWEWKPLNNFGFSYKTYLKSLWKFK